MVMMEPSQRQQVEQLERRLFRSTRDPVPAPAPTPLAAEPEPEQEPPAKRRRTTSSATTSASADAGAAVNRSSPPPQLPSVLYLLCQLGPAASALPQSPSSSTFSTPSPASPATPAAAADDDSPQLPLLEAGAPVACEEPLLQFIQQQQVLKLLQQQQQQNLHLQLLQQQQQLLFLLLQEQQRKERQLLMPPCEAALPSPGPKQHPFQQAQLTAAFPPPIVHKRRPPGTDRSKLFCHKCGKTDTPQWRSGPNGPATLCNACGLQYAQDKYKRMPGAAVQRRKFAARRVVCSL
eukprot:TRINITY_DN16944_c0_g1_i1.p1 TRINITY_DN16944_c0_g1~~TRINITY_DN16944_c0_g1_i1.p1  ORF type:complete len:320 (+),score=116.42 TRINITY_DN16944_c0_g1_i1:86-961(+)